MKNLQTFHLPPRWTTSTIKVLLIGAGGTGSQVADQLASMQATLMQLGHPGLEVYFADGDTVSRFNLGRQRFAEPDIGLNKAVVLTHRINLFYQLNWKALSYKFSAREIARDTDLLITCTDSARFRASVHANFKAKNSETLWLDCGNANRNGQVVLGHLGKPTKASFSTKAIKRLPNIVDLYPELATDTKQYDRYDAPSCSTEQALAKQDFPINRIAAIAAIDLIWTLIRSGQVAHHGLQFQSGPLSVNQMAIDPAAWEFYGYTPKKTKEESVCLT